MSKGIILAAGSAEELGPMMQVVSKYLMPVYDKPMVYYPLSTLMLAGIREILIVTRERDMVSFMELLGNGSRLGLGISYAARTREGRVRPAADEMVEGLLVAERFIGGERVCLIRGDNVFVGRLDFLREALESGDGATVFVSARRRRRRHSGAGAGGNRRNCFVEPFTEDSRAKRLFSGLRRAGAGWRRLGKRVAADAIELAAGNAGPGYDGGCRATRDYGAIEFDTTGDTVILKGRWGHSRGRYAVAGLYIYDERAVEIAKSLTAEACLMGPPSDRVVSELAGGALRPPAGVTIMDVNREYLRRGELRVRKISGGTAWLNVETESSLLAASNFVAAMERRGGGKIGCIEEAALRIGLIDGERLKRLIHDMPENGYCRYLSSVLTNSIGRQQKSVQDYAREALCETAGAAKRGS